MNNNSKDDVLKTLMKKALGYSSEEVVEEFSDNDGEIKLSKRKVTLKDVPPDLSAIKMVLESYNDKNVSELTDEELASEKERLLTILKNNS